MAGWIVRAAWAFLWTLCSVSFGLTAAPAAHADEAAAWFWEWSDGSRARERVIAEEPHAPWSSVPLLRVASAPPSPGRTVRLQVLRDGRWLTEDAARTSAEGRALLALNPYCEDGAWCDETAEYRLLVDAESARIRVRFRPA